MFPSSSVQHLGVIGGLISEIFCKSRASRAFAKCNWRWLLARWRDPPGIELIECHAKLCCESDEPVPTWPPTLQVISGAPVASSYVVAWLAQFDFKVNHFTLAWQDDERHILGRWTVDGRPQPHGWWDVTCNGSAADLFAITLLRDRLHGSQRRCRVLESSSA